MTAQGTITKELSNYLVNIFFVALRTFIDSSASIYHCPNAINEMMNFTSCTESISSHLIVTHLLADKINQSCGIYTQNIFFAKTKKLNPQQ